MPSRSDCNLTVNAAPYVDAKIRTTADRRILRYVIAYTRRAEKAMIYVQISDRKNKDSESRIHTSDLKSTNHVQSHDDGCRYNSAT